MMAIASGVKKDVKKGRGRMVLRIGGWGLGAGDKRLSRTSSDQLPRRQSTTREKEGKAIKAVGNASTGSELGRARCSHGRMMRVPMFHHVNETSFSRTTVPKYGSTITTKGYGSMRPAWARHDDNN